MEPFEGPGGGPSWPSDEADLLGRGSEWWFVASVDLPVDRWIGYVSGYWKAADLIVSHVADSGRDQHVLIYPFLMCWRHFAELHLKSLIILLGRYLREQTDLPKTHRIDHLWRVVRPMLERAFPGDAAAAQANAGRILLQLDGLDPTSEHFRYPIRKDGSQTLPTVNEVHMHRFHEAMEGVAHFLDASDTALRAEIDDRAKYEEEMAAHYHDEPDW
jgi:hypothetical protein